MVAHKSKKKKAKPQTRGDKEYLQQVFESSADAMLIINFDGKILEVNPATCSIYGYSVEELRELSATDLIHPDKQHFFATASEHIAKGQTYSSESINVCKDGATINVETCLTPLIYRDKPAILATIRDITKRKLVEKALRESEKKYRTIFEQFIDLYYQTDMRGIITNLSPSVKPMTGYDPDELIGRSVLDVYLNPVDQDNFVRELMKSGRVENYELKLVKKNGEVADVSINAHVVLGEDKEPVSIEGVIHDITEHKQAEEERRKLEEQIQQARRMEGLGVLAGGIAHDFNNLLTGVLGNADMALMKLSPVSPAYDSVEKIIISARRAADLVTQMLAYAGKGKTIVKPVNLSEVVEEMAHILDASIPDNTVVEYDLASDLPTVEADLLQVRQVVRNLFNNSMEALGEDGGTITVTTGAVECGPGLDCIPEPHFGAELREGSYVYLQVDDDGCGMDEEIQEKLFDPFFSTKFAGRGLSLPAALGIVRDHGGAISVRSQPGQGTTARILFPVS